MRKLDPKIVEAAAMDAFDSQAELHARRVLRAASENVPDEVVEEARKAYEAQNPFLTQSDHEDALRAAISAGLAKWAEEE